MLYDRILTVEKNSKLYVISSNIHNFQMPPDSARGI